MQLETSISKKFDNFSLEADFNLVSGCCGVFGPSGSGKSTLMNLLAGLIQPERGHICLSGQVLFDSSLRINLPPEKRRIGVVFQHSYLFPHMNVRKNLTYGWTRTKKPERRIDLDGLINVLGLQHLLTRGVASLSGGERQRVALARTMLACPRLILMDEPLTGLDEQLKYQIIPYLKKVFRQFNIPYLFISHSLQEMRLLTEEVLVLDHGRVAKSLPVEELARRQNGNGNRGYANLLSLYAPRSDEVLFIYQWGELELTATESGNAGENLFELGAKDITLFKLKPEATSARNLIPCQVKKIYGEGNLVSIELSCAGGLLVSQITTEAARQLDIREGTDLTAVIKASALRRLY